MVMCPILQASKPRRREGRLPAWATQVFLWAAHPPGGEATASTLRGTGRWLRRSGSYPTAPSAQTTSPHLAVSHARGYDLSFPSTVPARCSLLYWPVVYLEGRGRCCQRPLTSLPERRAKAGQSLGFSLGLRAWLLTHSHISSIHMCFKNTQRGQAGCDHVGET